MAVDWSRLLGLDFRHGLALALMLIAVAFLFWVWNGGKDDGKQVEDRQGQADEPPSG